MQATQIFVGCSIALFAASQASGANDRYCEAFANKMENEALYMASCLDSQNCLHKVVEQNSQSKLQNGNELFPLTPRMKYRFLFKTDFGDLNRGQVNSLVAIHVKQTDALPGGTLPRVRARRDAFDFACYRRDGIVEAWPPNGVRGRDLPSFSYDSFDHFHRFGYTGADDDKRLRYDFHVEYFNGQSCVTTMQPVRRSQFLMHDEGNFSGPLGALLERFGVGPPTASAQELNKVRNYERVKILVGNYRKVANSSGCFTFSTRAGTEKSVKIDIRINDLERQAKDYPFNTGRHDWSFELK